MRMVRIVMQLSSAPPPHPPEELKAQPIFPSSLSHRSNGTSSHHFFISQAIDPKFVGDPTATPSHQVRSSATASRVDFTRHSIPDTRATPSATAVAIFRVLPVLLK